MGKKKPSILSSNKTTQEQQKVISSSNNESNECSGYFFTKADAVIAACIFVATLSVYILTLAPTIFFGDSGEFAVASYHLGIVHPPGYPLYTLLGKLFILTIPLVDTAYRMNLMSAVFASGTAFIIYFIMLILNCRRYTAVLTSMVAAFSLTLWSQAVVTEVYTLYAFFFSLILLLTLLWLKKQSDITFFLLAFFAGLALTHHITIGAFYPIIAIVILIKEPGVLKRWRLLIKALIFFFLPLFLYLYLPIRSAANPPTDWGNPETLSAMLKHITAKQYSAKLLEHGMEGVFHQLGVFLKIFPQQFTPFLLILIIPGICFIFKKSRLNLVFFILTIVINVTYSVSYYIIDIDSYFIPTFVLTALFIGAGVELLISKTSKIRLPALKYSCISAGAVICLLPLVMNWNSCDRSGNYLARRYGENILKTIGKEGIFFSHGDNESFITTYLTLVEGIRKDVTVYDRTQNILPFPIVKGKDNVSKAAILQFERDIVTNSKKPVYFNFNADSTYNLVEYGILFRVARKNEEPDVLKDPWQEYNLEGIENESLYDDFMTRFVVGKYFEAMARRAWNQNDRNKADKYLAKALEVAGNQSTMLVVVGFFNIERERYELAQAQLKKALEINPFCSDCCNGLGTIAYSRSRYSEALDWYIKSIELDRNNLSVLINRGLAYERIGDNETDPKVKEEYYKLAVEDFKYVRENDPYNPNIEKNLNRLSEKFAPIKEVREKYEKKLAENPGDASIIYDYGVYLAKQNMYDEAIVQFKNAIKIDSRYTSAMTDLGGAYLKIRREDLALQQFKKVLEIDPDNNKAKKGIEMIKNAVKSGKVRMKLSEFD